MWVPFNEGRGRFDAREMTKLIREIDNQRLVAETSGWFDQGGGDFYTIHNYLKKLKVKPKLDRIVALMEYGRYSLTTDVEGEINGLFTYDREMLKMDAKVIQNWNHAVYHLFDSLTTRTKKDSGDKGLL